MRLEQHGCSGYMVLVLGSIVELVVGSIVELGLDSSGYKLVELGLDSSGCKLELGRGGRRCHKLGSQGTLEEIFYVS